MTYHMMVNISGYKSASQRARIFSEEWVASQFRCPRCILPLEQTPNNTAARDFVCHGCKQGFELKSKLGAFGNMVTDGAYNSMLKAVRSENCPNLLLLSYSPDYQVRHLVAIPRRFLIEEIVVPRKPLGSHCRRAGWQGCNLNIGLLPPDGLINCVHEYNALPVEHIQMEWNRTAFLDDIKLGARGWLAVTMKLIRQLQKDQFTLQDLYKLELEAQKAFPQNSHVRAKLRQQLQILREQRWLNFEGNGNYHLIN